MEEVMAGITNKDQHKARTQEQTRSTRTQNQNFLMPETGLFRTQTGPFSAPCTSQFWTRLSRTPTELTESLH